MRVEPIQEQVQNPETEFNNPPVLRDGEAGPMTWSAPPLLEDYVPPASGVYRLRVGCEFVHETDYTTPAVLQVEARRDGPHTIFSETWETSPAVPSHVYFDTYGNLCRRLNLPAGRSTLRYDALVEVPSAPDEIDWNAQQQPVDELPDETLLHTLASRYCLSDSLADIAWQLFGATPRGWARVQAANDWIYNNIKYEIGWSTPATNALEAYDNRAGICRDFAHLGISFCRALNIPARYCSGYLPDIGVVAPPTDMDFHAWFEAYLGGRWHTFDARHNILRRGRVVITRGRDAVDCAMITTYGAADLKRMTVWADEAS